MSAPRAAVPAGPITASCSKSVRRLGSSASDKAPASRRKGRRHAQAKAPAARGLACADREAFRIAYEPGDIFDESRGPGAHHSDGWRRMILTTYRRWLGFLTAHHPSDLLKPPAERITPQRIRDFIDHIDAEVRPTTVSMAMAHLHCFAGLVAPTTDWRWLASIKARLAARAKPEDRFDRLVPGWHTLDLGMEMMDEAAGLPLSPKQRDLHYRNGLLIALISVWLIRRRSIAALTVSRHLEFDAAA